MSLVPTTELLKVGTFGSGKNVFNNTSESICKNRNSLTDRENEFVVTKGDSEAGGETNQEYGINRYKSLYIVGDRKNKRKADSGKGCRRNL